MKKGLLLLIILMAGCTAADRGAVKSGIVYEKGHIGGSVEYVYDKQGKLEYEIRKDAEGGAVKKIVYSTEAKDIYAPQRIEIAASKKTIYADGDDSAEITVKMFNKYGDEISGKNGEIYVNGELYSKKKFRTEKAGEYSVIVKYKEVESNKEYIRARDFPDAVTPDYLAFFNHNKLHNIELKITRAEWNRLNSMLKANKDSAEDVRAEMIYTGELGKEVFENIGFRVRGNASRAMPENNGIYTKAPFKLSFDETFDLKNDDPKYNKIKNRRLFGLASLNLKWNRKYDDTQIREMFNYELMEKAGVTVPKTASVILKINIDGEIHNYGLYTAVEPIDKEYLTKRFGPLADRGNLYKCLYPATLGLSSLANPMSVGLEDEKKGYRPVYDLKTNKKKNDNSGIYEFIRAVDYYRGEAFARYLDENFEVDKFIRYMAMNTLIGMYDDYRDNINNFYIYFNNKGKIEFMPYDYDSGLGGGWPGWNYDGIVNSKIYRDNTSSILSSKILKIERYKKLYTTYIEEFARFENPIFSYENFEKKYYQMKKIYDGKIENDMDLGDEMKLDPVVEKYMTERLKSVRDQLGMKPKIDRGPKNPDLSITNAEEFLAKIGTIEADKRDRFVYDNFAAVYKSEFPIIKGEQATFLYKSDGKEIKRLELRGEMNGWGFVKEFSDRYKFDNIEGTDIYVLTIDIPKGSYEYKIVINRMNETIEEIVKMTEDERRKLNWDFEWLMDTLNPKEKLGGFGANSYFEIK